jgi:L-ascorbate metabolism protein UlaG (beta-lactamase superfamily)
VVRKYSVRASLGHDWDMTSSTFTVEWFGCTTFRIVARDLTIWFDTFVDRAPGADPVGLTAREIDRADAVFVSHAHFDHILGADTVAANTGAPIVGSYESIRVMREAGVPEPQLWPASGGESVHLADDVRVRVFPSLHSCLFATVDLDAGAPCLGDLGIGYAERRARVDEVFAGLERVVPPDYAHTIAHGASRHDGGQLNYLLETPDGSAFVAASSGCWSGILRDLRPDVAILAVTGRPNLDGEPFQGSMADFVATEVELLRPDEVVYCHHDAWMPPLPAIDPGPVTRALAERAPAARVRELRYGDPARLST